MPGVTLPAEPVQALDHEVKFVFPGAMFAVARTILHGVCRREEPHAESLVETIYFDGPGLESLEEKLGSDYLQDQDPPALVRPLAGGLARGQAPGRQPAREAAAARGPLAPIPLDGRELSRRSLDSPALAGVPALLAGAGEAAPAGLRPAVHLTYRRERFVEPASGLRIALDSEITALRIADWAAAAPGIRRLPGNLRSPFLVELKGGSRDLPPALAALAALGGRRESFSKYSFCLVD